MVLRSHSSQFLLFSEFPMVLPNLLNHCVIPQALVGQVDNQKRFREYSYPLVYFTAFPIRGKAFWNSKWEELDVSQDLERFSSLQILRVVLCNLRTWFRSINSLYVTPDHAAYIENSSIFCWVTWSSSLQQRLFNSSSSRQLLAWHSWWRRLFISNSLHKCMLWRWAWSAHWLAFNNCRLWDSCSRCDSIDAYSEFLRSKFWMSMLYSVEYNFLWTEFSPRKSCWSLRSRCSRRSRSSE